MSRALVVVNPVAGGGRAARIWSSLSASIDSWREIECVTTRAPGDAIRLASDAAALGLERVIAVGGDGTVSEIARGVAGSETALGMVPAGSGNDFSHTLGVPRTPGAAARLALHGSTRRVDAGWVDTTEQQRLFVNIAGCGFDAEVVARTSSGRRMGGALLYLSGVLRTLMSFRPVSLRLLVDGRAFERAALGIAVANGPRYGGGMRIAPRARVDDGVFDVCVVGDVTPAQVVRMLPRLYAGTHCGHPAVEFFRCRDISIEPMSQRGVACQADGELVGSLPARFRIQPLALTCVGRRAP